MSTASARAAAQSTAPMIGASPLPEMSPRLEATRRSVWSGLRWAVLGNVVYAFSQYGMVVALAQVGTPQIVGQYALALAIAGPVMFFCNLQLRAILASDAGRMHEFAEYWRLRILTAPIAWAVVAAIAYAGRFAAETAIVIFVAGAIKSLETLSDLCYGASQRDNRLDLVGKSLAMKGPLSLVLLAAVTWATQSVAIGMASVGAAWLALLFFYDLPNVYRADPAGAMLNAPGAGWTAQRRLFAVGLPLGSSIALLSLTVSLPNVLVERFFGEHDVGVYAALSSLAWAGIPLINAFGQTAMPRLGYLYVAGDYRRLRILVTSLAALGAALGIAGVLGAWFFGEPLVSLFYGPDYTGRLDVLIWLMAAASLLFAVRFVADALTAMRRTRIQIVAQGAATLVVFAGSMAVLPDFGLAGVARILTAAFALRGLILTASFFSESRQSAPSLKLYCE